MSTTLATVADVNAQRPKAVIEDASGDIWQFRQRVYGASWYRPGDRQPHGSRDIALPALLLRTGEPYERDECGE